MSIKNDYFVKSIKKEETYDWLLHKHYAKRIPSISYAFGLYSDKLEGVCTFGTPASSTLLKGVCGDKYSTIVKELNRLVVNKTGKNQSSYFISKCFKLLTKPLIIISYADTSRNHHGYVYQATNWIYTGLSAKFTNPMVKGLEHKHHASYGHGLTNKQLKEKYGDSFYLKERPQKHRYVYFLGDRRQVKEMKSKLKYPILPYPKGDNKRYDASYEPITQEILF